MCIFDKKGEVDMANPKLPNISEAEQSLLYEKLNTYNQNKAAFKEVGCYLVVTPRDNHPTYSLWFYTPLLERKPFLYIEELSTDITLSLRIITSKLWYVNRRIFIVDYNEQKMSGNGDDLVPFGKYRGHFLHEILKIDPAYINWIAYKFTPKIPKQERFVKMATAYNTIYMDMVLKKIRQVSPGSHYIGKKGDKLTNLTLKVTKVQLEDDPYKTRFIGTTPQFFVRQRLTAVDPSGNLLNITIPAVNPSSVSTRLSSLEHTFQLGEILHITSAHIAGTYESRGIQYTRLTYIKFGK